jgi:hypothetical protein
MYILFLVAFMYYYRYDYLFIVNNLYLYFKRQVELDYTIRSIDELSSGFYLTTYNNGKKFYYIGKEPIVYSREEILESIQKSSHKMVKLDSDIIMGEIVVYNPLTSKKSTIDALEFTQMLSGPLGDFYMGRVENYIENSLTNINISELARHYYGTPTLVVELTAMDSAGTDYCLK